MSQDVAPFAGAWIETSKLLKGIIYTLPVAPFAGAWIETSQRSVFTNREGCRALRGRVD